MKNKLNRKYGLMSEFILLFVLFILITIEFSVVMTYLEQNRRYHDLYMGELADINDYLVRALEADGEEFYELKQFHKEHMDQLKIPYKYPDNADAEYEAFQTAFAEQYPGKLFGRDVTFAGLNDECRLLYARYKYITWLNIFDRIRAAHDLRYVYFIYPTEEELNMCYMLDDPKEEEVIDGVTYLKMGITVYEDPSIHAAMWEAANTLKNPAEMDIMDNAQGYVYSYPSPVVYNGELLGVVATELNVSFIRGFILSSVRRLATVSIFVLGICSLLMLFAIKHLVLDRIILLEGFVRTYSREKDPSLAGAITKASAGKRDEIGSLAGEFSGMITALDTYMNDLQSITAEKERISIELTVAKDIQASMLPRIFPAFPDVDEFEMFASMEPAKEVGGDFYDFFMIDEYHVALVVADVSGKGVPAALFMAISKSMIRDKTLDSRDCSDPASVLMHVNNQLCKENDTELFVTVWLGILDIRSGLLVFSDAGHEYPVLAKAGGEIGLLKAVKKKPPVATIENIGYVNTEYMMEVGDLLFLYTDGVPEATNANDELYGMDRLMEFVREKRDMDPMELLPAVRKNVDSFVGSAPQFDDLTMLAIRFLKKAEENDGSD